MMLKVYRIALMLGLVLSLIIIAGCGEKTPEDIFITAQKALNNLESYSATITYRVVDGQEEREYRFKQWVSMPNCFKIQLIDQANAVEKIIVSDGREMLVENPEIGDSLRLEVEALEQQRPLFIGDFLGSFWMAEDVGKRIHIDEGTEYVVFTCPFADTELSRGSQELWLRAPKMVPTRMVTYDNNHKIASLILFEEFDGSWKADEDFFEIRD